MKIKVEGGQRDITIATLPSVARDIYKGTTHSENFDRCPVALITQIIRISNSPCTRSLKYVSEERSLRRYWNTELP